MSTPYQLGTNSGLSQSTIENIRAKAEQNAQMQTPTPEKQAVYDAFQKQYINKIQEKARTGAQLDTPNDWKNSIYQQALSGNQVNQGNQGFLSIDEYMKNAQSNSQAQMQAMQQYLQSMSQQHLASQQAQLGMARDQQLAEIEMALQKAIANGQLSIRQAEQQFEEAKKGIYDQAYRDSELTNLTAHDRGIQNSAQMIGLMQGDAYRRDSLLNQNLTTRDQSINEINQQLNQLKYEADINKGLANSQYNYGMAGASADINAKMLEQLANMSFQDYQRLADQGFKLNVMGLEQQFALEQMAKQHGYDLSKLSEQQRYQLEQMAIQQGYNKENMQTEQNFALEKLSVQQRYQLEQMARSFGYDLSKMSIDQQYKLAQMAQGFGYDMSLQNSSQNFQAGQNALDRQAQMQLQQMRNDHDLTMLSKEQQAELDKYSVELSRKLAQYEENTPENKLLKAEFNFALESMKAEASANLASELGAKRLATLLESYPKEMPNPSDKKAVDDYNAKVEALNAQVESLTKGDGYKYTMDKLKSSSKHTEEEKSGFLNFIKTGIKGFQMPSINLLP